MNKVAISSRVNKILEKAQKIEKSGYSEIIEKALQDYLRKKLRWQQIKKWGSASAKKAGISNMKDVEEFIDEIRK